MRDFSEYPKVRYSANGPITVNDRAEEDAIEGETFDLPNLTNLPHDFDPAAVNDQPSDNTYTHEEYPKWVGGVIVNDAEEEAAVLGSADAVEEETKAPKTTKKAAKAADGDDLL